MYQDYCGLFGPVVAPNSGFESKLCRIYIIVVVRMLCSKLFKGLCSVVYGNVHYKEPLKSVDKSGAYSRLRASFYRDIAMLVQKATLSNNHDIYDVSSWIMVW